MTQSAYDDLTKVFERYASALAWAVGAGAALPTSAYQANLSPPWPTGIVLITVIIEIVAIFWAFLSSRKSDDKALRRRSAWSLFGVVFFLVAYLVALSQLEFYGGPAKERLVKGLACTSEALRIPEFKSQCPFLNATLIAKAEDPERLWTTQSITLSRSLLLALWIGFFLCFAYFLTGIISFLSRQKSNFRGETRQSP